MRNSGQLIFAVVVILIGVVLLADSMLDVDVWSFAWPIGIILLGVFLLLRPKLVGADTSVGYKLLGDIKRKGDWEVSEEEIWIGVGDVRLDMSSAEIPLGETCIRVQGFVSDVRLYVPQDVGVALSSNAFYSEVRLFGKKHERFLSPVNLASDDYETAERRVRLEMSMFVSDVRVRRV
jgi:predicted membrane protein